VTAILGNSLWLRDGMTYRQETLDILAKNYFASSFSGKMGTEEYNQALRDWINEQTNGLLAEQARGLGMDADTVLALASTLYFKAAWNGEFQKENTGTDTFHALSGDVDGPFMRRVIESGVYYWGERFAAVELRFQEGGSMWLILPDEGDSVDDLLKSGEAMDFLLADKGLTGDQQDYAWPDQKVAQINLSMPKFDVSSDLDLSEGLKSLGVTDVFDSSVSNFDPLGASTDDPLYVSQAQHAARVKVDEEGCEAAAFTVVTMNPTSAAPPNDEVDFTLDRPFLFAVTGDSGLPLFTGVVNQPNG
jgi:serine protease inhibitor